MLSLSKEKLLSTLLFFFYLALLASLVFSWRAVSSAGLGLILLAGILQTKIARKNFFLHSLYSAFFISCLLLFLLTCVALFYTNNMHEGLSQVQKKTGIAVIPLALFASHWFLEQEKFSRLMDYFTLLIFLGCLICLINAGFIFFDSGKASVFFYHDLVKPLKQHAIQFSILVFFVLLYLLEDAGMNRILTGKWPVALVFFFSVMLILLSSKLILLVYFVYLLYFIFRKQKLDSGKFAFLLVFLLLAVTVLLSTSNPFSARFRSLFSGNKGLFLQEKFNPGTYFNGIQFRLLQWRLTGEILNENKAWLYGVGAGDAQDHLNKKYEQKNMYLGEPGLPKQGYWNYHTHNQFLQTLLQNGLAGLLALLVFWMALAVCAKKSNSRGLQVFVLMLFLYCFSDAPLETQYGMLLLIFLPLFSYLSHRFNEELKNQAKALATI